MVLTNMAVDIWAALKFLGILEPIRGSGIRVWPESGF
jgi:hypothetical protein